LVRSSHFMRIITGCQLARVRQGGELPVEGELPLIEGAAEQRQELAPEHAAEHAHREEDPGLASEPLRAVKRQPAAWHDTVDVRVVLEGSSPRRGRPGHRPGALTGRCVVSGDDSGKEPISRPRDLPVFAEQGQQARR